MSEGYQGEEKRLFRRFGHSESVQLQFKESSQFYGSLSSDLSEGGVRIRLNEFMPLNTELSLEVRLANENLVSCAGRVVWVEKARFGDSYYAGLEFSKNDSIIINQQKIEKFLKHKQNLSVTN